MKKIEPLFKSSRAILIALFFLALAMIACGRSQVQEDHELSSAQTEATIMITQTVPELPPTQTESPSQPADNPTVTALPDEPPDAPDMPPTPEIPDILFEGISLRYNRAVASDIFPSTIPEQIMDEDFPIPELTYPTHIQFEFENYQVSQHFHTPIIRVYPVDAFIAVNERVHVTVASLQSALNNCPSGGLFTPLPFLPHWNAAAILSTKVACFDFQNGSGLRYLTMWGQGPTPLDNQNLFYTYQGITHDGRFYISAILPITHPNLPDDGLAGVTDWVEAAEIWAEEYPAAIIMLVEQPLSSFTPNIEYLDEMMASILIEK